jgi:uncharacterized protein Usg
MATIWVVEQGEYSDYRVVRVFSSKENAQQIADAINAPRENGYGGDRATVAEWSLDPAVHELRQGFTPFLVDMREDGTTERCDRLDVSGYEVAGSVRMWRRTQAPAFRGNPDKPDVLQTIVWAKDDAHAIKITNEHRTRLIASGEWHTLESA